MVTATVIPWERFSGLILRTDDGEEIYVEVIDIDWLPVREDLRTWVGRRFTVKIVGWNEGTSSWKGSIKAAQPERNPWRDPSVYALGTVHDATVTMRLPYGTWVRLDAAGLYALIRDRVAREVGTSLRVQVRALEVERKSIEVEPVDEVS